MNFGEVLGTEEDQFYFFVTHEKKNLPLRALCCGVDLLLIESDKLKYRGLFSLKDD